MKLATGSKTEKSKSAPEFRPELKRPNESIGIVPRREKITLLTRRLFNVLLFLSQEDGIKPRYRRPLKDLLAHTGSDSNNTEVLKEQLRKMRRIEVVWNTTTGTIAQASSEKEYEHRWGVSGMIKEVEIIGPPGGGPAWIEWELPSALQKELLNPTLYTRLSLLMQNDFRSASSMALFEICQRYATNPTKLTCRETWEWWKPRLTGNPRDVSVMGEYKIFKRDVLKPAISEINQVTDLEISLLEFKEGRKVHDIQFSIVLKKQAQLDISSPSNLFDATVVERIIRLGIDQAEAARMYADHEESVLQLTLDYVDKRSKSNAMSPLEAPAAYFRKALKLGYAMKAGSAGAKKALQLRQKEDDSQQILADVETAFSMQRTAEARRYYAEVPEEKKVEYQAHFGESTDAANNPRLKADFQKHGLKQAHVQASFYGWLARHVWGAASDRDLAEFAATHSNK